jgi:hypothetical protein
VGGKQLALSGICNALEIAGGNAAPEQTHANARGSTTQQCTVTLCQKRLKDSREHVLQICSKTLHMGASEAAARNMRV